RESDYFSAAPADSITCCLLSPERKFGTSVLGAASNKIHHSSWRRKTKLKMAREFASLMLLNEKAKAEQTNEMRAESGGILKSLRLYAVAGGVCGDPADNRPWLLLRMRRALLAAALPSSVMNARRFMDFP